MSSHYREHVSYPNVTAGPYPPQLAAALDNVASNVQDDSNPRHCSVKGCSVPLSPDYPHKMCEECRGRHRVYAMTKRAKRKMEKALLNGSAQNGQPVAWMPPDDAAEAEEEHPGQQPPEPVVGPSRQFESPPQEPMEESNQPEYDFSQQWDANSIDPRLFSQIQSHTSELAGALTLPPPPHHPANHETYSRNSHPPQQQSRAHSAASPPAPPPPPPAPEIHPILAEVLKSVPGVNLTTRFTSGPTVFPGPADGPLPPRFCSIKGCKTLIAGNSFFKMCEPCRDRYRNYGTTKRAKWKREKEVAVAELHQLRDKEDVRRASEGLPPLPPPDGEHWQEYQPGEGEPTDSSSGARPSGSPGPTDTGEECSSSSTGLPPRMCTVSHCREILPGGYEFLRCERHRIQNRHHSKLKRVRDKEVKAQVYDGWAAAIAPRADGERPADGGDPTPAAAMDPDAAAAQEIAFTFSELADPARDGMESEYITEAAAVDFIHETGTGISPTLALHMTDQEDTPLGEPMTGVPPAARGTRRTNHVCSIKACSNLLSPSNPWKMCDLCRSRDRAGRRIKALRDSGLIPPEEAAAKIVEVRMEVEGKERRERKDKGTKKKNKGKKKKKRDAEEGAREGLDESSGLGHGEGSSGGAADEGVVAAQGGGDPQTSVFSSVPVPNHANLVFMQPVFGQLPPHFQQYYAQAAGSSVPSTTSRSSESGGLGAGDGSAPPLTNGADTGNAPPATPKKRGKGKGKAKATEQESASQPTDASMSASQAPPAHYPPPNGHPYPYYMPPFMSPYGAPPGFPYGYPAPPPSPTKGGAYSPPAYQPPPYGAYPYPYPYPGHPYPYPGQPYPPPPGQSYSPPPAGQAYTPPPPYPPPPSGEQSETHQPPYPHPMPPYPYAHPYPVPPPPPPHQPPTTEQPQQQPQQPSSSAPEDPPILGQSSASTKRSKSSKASTKGNSAKGNAAKDPPPHNFAEVEQPAQKGRTFIVRTSQTYESPVTNGAKPFSLKRRRDEDGGGATSPNKRAEPEAWTYSQFRVSLNGTPVPTPSPPIPVTSVLNPSDFAHAAAPVPVVEENVVAAPTTAAIVENGVSVSEKQGQCGNKTCKRVLPSGTAGSLCERCRERLKKKQAKAKQRFKLEPKALLRRDLADAVTA